MSVVVERGLARCPRCVAVADYTFVESGPNSLRYEVHCRRCGEDYCEVHAPVAPGFSAAVEALAFRPLVIPPSGFELRRRRAAKRCSVLTAAAVAQITRIITAVRSLRRPDDA